MSTTLIRGTQVLDGTIQRPDLDVTTVSKAVVAKIIQGTNVTLTSTGADSGTGDVTISVPGGGIGPAGGNAYTTTSASFTVPAKGSTITVNVADATWVAVGQFVYVDQAGGTGQAGAMQVTAKTSGSLTLLTPP
jgi:hypothetical protein